MDKQFDLLWAEEFPPATPEVLRNIEKFLAEDDEDDLFDEEESEYHVIERLPEVQEMVAQAVEEVQALIRHYEKLPPRLDWVRAAREKDELYQARRVAARKERLEHLRQLPDLEIYGHPALKVANFRELEGSVEELPREDLLALILNYEFSEDLA